MPASVEKTSWDKGKGCNMQFGTRVKLKDSALKDEILKLINEDANFDWICYITSLYNEEGIVEGFFPDKDAPPGTLLIRWDTGSDAWDGYLNEGQDGEALYGWFENELEIVEG